MKVAFCLYEGMTVLDFIGVYDPLTRLDRRDELTIQWDICAPTSPVTANRLEIAVDRVAPDLGDYDLVFVPGGQASRELRHDESFLAWLRTAKSCDYLASVCTGSLLLGAAGLLEGKRATTHPDAMGRLGEYADVVTDRVVNDGNVITGRGVSSSLDLGLYLVELLTDPDTRKDIATQMDYPYGRDVFGSA